jgi:serine/threonine protein kinase
MHRDIKPDNILLDEKNQPRICDLGMAKMAQEDYKMTNTMGSPVYMAPEILNKQSGVWGYPADVYAFAISCYQIAGGTKWPPSWIRQISQLSKEIIKGTRPDVRGFSDRGFATLLENMWANNPTERPTFKGVADALKEPENWLAGVDRQKFTEYTTWLENQPISLPPAGLCACLERVKLATTIIYRVPQDRSILERFAIVLSFICSDEADHQNEISQFIQAQLNKNQSLSRIEALNVSTALIQDTEQAENAGIDDHEEEADEDKVNDSEEENPGEQWTQPEGNICHLRVSRNDTSFPIDITLPAETTVAGLHQALQNVVGARVTIRNVNRIIPADSTQVLTESNLTDLVLDVVVNPN